MIAFRSAILFLPVLIGIGVGCARPSEQEANAKQEPPAEPNKAQTADDVQSPTGESLIATFRKWHQADQITDAAEREMMMGLIFVNHDDVKTIFKDMAERLQEVIDLQIELDKLANADRSKRLLIEKIEAVDVRELLKKGDDATDGRWLKSISEMFPKDAPVYLLLIQWKKPNGAQNMGPFFYLNGRWVFVPDPGDMYEVAINKISAEEVDRYVKQLRRRLEQAREQAAKRAE